MMSSRKTTADEVYFVTLVVVGWIDLFTRSDYKYLLVENLDYCRKHEGLRIFSYVIMSNHLHMICLRDDADLDELLGRFKSYTSKILLNAVKDNPRESRSEWMLHQFRHNAKYRRKYDEYHLWKTDHHPILLYSPEVFEQKRNYIHQNPVRAGIVDDPTHYLFSSACPNNPLELDPIS